MCLHSCLPWATQTLSPQPLSHLSVCHDFRGAETIVRFTNRLTNNTLFPPDRVPCTNGRVGWPVSIHLHGAQTLSPYDGWAEDELCGEEEKDYVYPITRAATQWYHDHALHITSLNAYYGLAGFFIATDNPAEGGRGSPFNLDNIPELLFMLSDRLVDGQCQLAIDTLGPHKKSFFGDINMVSGIPWPRATVDPRSYNLRLLNAAASRPYLIRFVDSAKNDIGPEICQHVASSGGYLSSPRPFSAEGLRMGGAERYEVVCDFSRFAGQEVYMLNGRHDTFKDVPYFCYSHLLVKFVVRTEEQACQDQPGCSIASFPRLTSFNPAPLDLVLTEADIDTALNMALAGNYTRNLEFGRNGGQWTINGETWDSFRVLAADVGQNTWELWHMKTMGGWFHPVHIHLADMILLARDGNPVNLLPYERMAKIDVANLWPGTDVDVVVRFGPHRGDYMFHCHNYVHEDDDMMSSLTVLEYELGRNVGTQFPSAPELFNATSIVYDDFNYKDPRNPATVPRPVGTFPTFNETYLQFILDLNIYRIFFPSPTDPEVLLGAQNPWRVA